MLRPQRVGDSWATIVDTDQQRVKLILTYDPRPDRREDYFQYVLGEFVPRLASEGLAMSDAWHTAYGQYPLRLTGFVAPDMASLERILTSQTFRDLEARLQEYVSNYQRRIVPARRGFQF